MVNFNEKMPRERARAINAVVLAFVGDAAYSLFVREGLVFGHDYKTGTLQKLAAARVSAKGQAATLERVFSRLTDEERDIFLRGRNAKKPTKSKNASAPNTTFPRGSRRSSAFCTSWAITGASANCWREKTNEN